MDFHPRVPSIAIIGSGPTGIYTSKYLLKERVALSITMFEAQKQAGRGTPYHQDWNEKEMLANIASIEIPPVMETLVTWLNTLSDQQLANIGISREQIDERTFFPRIALGEYFQAQLTKLIDTAHKMDNSFILKNGQKVIDVIAVHDGIRLTVQRHDGKTETSIFDYVVMATGHVWPKETEIKPGYFLAPWPSCALKTIQDCHVGIRGTSLSALDAMVALSVARGSFERNTKDELEYLPEPGTENFRITMLSRKGILPEADFFCPIPYTPLKICTPETVEKLIASGKGIGLLDDIFALFKAELFACDPAYCNKIKLKDLTLEQFSSAYFHEREQHDPFVWAAMNLAEAKLHYKQQYTVPWRYAILRMHEVIARMVPKLHTEDYHRFNRFFKHIFVDDYATVPHESIERILALHKAGKLTILHVGEDYTLDTESTASGVILRKDGVDRYFPAFIEAMGQRPLSIHEFPFPGIWKQGLVQQASTFDYFYTQSRHWIRKETQSRGIALDSTYHPISDSAYASRLYCLGLPFLLGQFPFAQGITSSSNMGEKVAKDIIQQVAYDGAEAFIAPVQRQPSETIA